MKNYSKPKMMAKNAPTGSYAAGCPELKHGPQATGTYDGKFRVVGCKACEMAQ